MAKVIEFRFEDDKLADMFLGYMSDGGGEYRFMTSDDVEDVDFNYWDANGGKFGPVVIVSGRALE